MLKWIIDVFKKLELILSLFVEESLLLLVILMNVFYKDDILWSVYYGSKIYKWFEMMLDDNIVYRIGSVIKLFVVLLMYKLYEEGKIFLIDDFLSKYVLNFVIKNFFIGENIILCEIVS